eukprot:8932566-Alexandrium_andersonii.AAC.1
MSRRRLPEPAPAAWTGRVRHRAALTPTCADGRYPSAWKLGTAAARSAAALLRRSQRRSRQRALPHPARTPPPPP